MSRRIVGIVAVAAVGCVVGILIFGDEAPVSPAPKATVSKPVPPKPPFVPKPEPPVVKEPLEGATVSLAKLLETSAGKPAPLAEEISKPEALSPPAEKPEINPVPETAPAVVPAVRANEENLTPVPQEDTSRVETVVTEKAVPVQEVVVYEEAPPRGTVIGVQSSLLSTVYWYDGYYWGYNPSCRNYVIVTDLAVIGRYGHYERRHSNWVSYDSGWGVGIQAESNWHGRREQCDLRGLTEVTISGSHATGSSWQSPIVPRQHTNQETAQRVPRQEPVFQRATRQQPPAIRQEAPQQVVRQQTSTVQPGVRQQRQQVVSQKVPTVQRGVQQRQTSPAIRQVVPQRQQPFQGRQSVLQKAPAFQRGVQQRQQSPVARQAPRQQTFTQPRQQAVRQLQVGRQTMGQSPLQGRSMRQHR